MALASDITTQHALVTRLRLRRSHRPTSMRLNITAMLDVMLQLLIFLLATAGLALDEGVLPTQLPPQSPAADSARDLHPLLVTVSSDGPQGYRLTVSASGDNPADFSQLCARLEEQQLDPQRQRAGAYPPDHPLIIKAEGKVHWQHVVSALNAAVRAGYSNVQLADDPVAATAGLSDR
jgi:biopolymer transport protein ExbD